MTGSSATAFAEEVLYEFSPDDFLVDCTEDGQHVFWFRRLEGGLKACLVWGGVPGAEFDDLLTGPDGLLLSFSPDGRHIAYTVSREGRFAVGIDDEIGAEFADVDRAVPPTFSPDGMHVAYRAQIDGAFRMLVDGTASSDFEPVEGPPVFSPDSKHLAFVAVGSNGKQFVVLDAVGGPEFDLVGGAPIEGKPEFSLVFSPDGKHLAYDASRGRDWHVVLDGDVGPAFEQIAGFVVFGPSGERFAYQAVSRSKYLVVQDGTAGALYDDVSRPVFSPDGRSLAYVAKQDKHKAMIVDGEQGERFDDVYVRADTRALGYGFSPDGQHFAYLACTGKGFLHGGRWFAVADGTRGPEFDEVGSELGGTAWERAMAGEPKFSPDSKHLAFPARRGKQWSIVHDGVPGPGFHLVGYPCFTADGHFAHVGKLDKTRAVVVFDGQPGPEMTDLYVPGGRSPLAVDRSGSHVAYVGFTDGAWRPVVDGVVGPPADGMLQPMFGEDGRMVFVGLHGTEGDSMKVIRLTYAPAAPATSL